MYLAILLILLGGGIFIGYRGLKTESRFLFAMGIVVCALTVFLFGTLSFWGEMLWFEALGYGERFWEVVLWKAGLSAVGAVLGCGIITLLLLPLPSQHLKMRYMAQALGFLVGVSWGYAQWETVVRFLYRVETEVTEPILNMDSGFYLFSLPFWNGLQDFLLSLSVIAALAAALSLFVRISPREIDLQGWENLPSEASDYRPLYLAGGVLLIVAAGGMFLDRYHLLFSTMGVVTGPGWTDVHVRLPAYLVITIVLFLTGVLLLASPLRTRILRTAFFQRMAPNTRHTAFLGILGGFCVVVWFIGLKVLPWGFQSLLVEPNEITYERPYIQNNIKFTRHGFNVHKVEEKEFPVVPELTRDMLRANRGTIDNARLWDWRALDAVYKQFQEIRLYYEFRDVDVDRYTFGGQYRQVMISAREMEVDNLPPQSQTFVNRRFKYTHGFGVTLTGVNEFTPEGLPRLLIRDIPPVSAYPELEVEQPRIYYGELTTTPVIGNSEEPEFDYPQGDENAYIHYPGTGGVQLSSLWRKFLFGWKFDGTKFLLSGYPTEESRILFHRQIRQRVEKLAPFLTFDKDPYVVLSEGRLYWIIDAYTTSDRFPYSERFSPASPYGRTGRGQSGFPAPEVNHLAGNNYIRNSVKAVVDAFNGSVEFYIFDESDPIITVWNRIFPDLFQTQEEMDPVLRRHVRYPIDFLLVQGLVYAKYHMTNPNVFYNQEDLWIRATENYHGQVQPVEPYFIMWEPPGSDELQYILMLPFTPKNRQVLIGWIAGMCDGENYGRFLSYNFPKEKRVLGTQQVETKIDQDSFLSGQLSLWDQRGSSVVRGNVLVIPIDETLLYIEPIYLQAETAAYPELRLVVVMHKDNLSYAENFEEALEGIFEPQEAKAITAPGVPGQTIGQLGRLANEAFTSYLENVGQGNFQEAARALERLQNLLGRLNQQSQGEGESQEQE